MTCGYAYDPFGEDRETSYYAYDENSGNDDDDDDEFFEKNQLLGAQMQHWLLVKNIVLFCV